MLGNCQDFQAVPGCGISCRVSNVEHLLQQQNEERFLLPGATSDESRLLSAAEAPSAGLMSFGFWGSPAYIYLLTVHSTIKNKSFLLHMSFPFVGKQQSYSVLIGNREWMRRNGHHIGADVDGAMSSHETKGQTAILVAIDGEDTHLQASSNSDVLGEVVAQIVSFVCVCPV